MNKGRSLPYILIAIFISPFVLADRYGRVEVFDKDTVGEWGYEVNSEYAYAVTETGQYPVRGYQGKLISICYDDCYIKIEASSWTFSKFMGGNVCKSGVRGDVKINMETARHTLPGMCFYKDVIGIYVTIPFDPRLYSDMEESETAFVRITDTKTDEFISSHMFSLKGANIALPKVRDYGIHLGYFDSRKELPDRYYGKEKKQSAAKKLSGIY